VKKKGEASVSSTPEQGEKKGSRGEVGLSSEKTVEKERKREEAAGERYLEKKKV